MHKKSWKVTVRTNGMQLKTFSMDPSPEQLYGYMHKRYPGGNYQSVYEAGFCGYWIDRELKRYGFNNIVINPADVPSTQSLSKGRNIEGLLLCTCAEPVKASRQRT